MIYQRPSAEHLPYKEYGYRCPYNPARCAEGIFGERVSMWQCQRKPGHGERGLFCKQHAKRYPEPKP